MIEDARVFQEEFVPRDVVHRDQEANRIERALHPLVDGEPGSDVFLFGPTGTGKTTVGRYLLEVLGRAAPDLGTGYLNCWRHASRYDVLYRLVRGLTGAIDVHRTATPADDLLDRLDAADGRQVVMLDEVDRLEEPEVLYDLYHVPNLTLVHVANREVDLFADLPDRIRSRIRVGYRVEFARYGVEALLDILDARARAGLQPGAIDRTGLEWIARAADGDARVAIAALRTAARMAEDRGADRIAPADLEPAIPRAVARPGHPRVESLDEHRRVLLDVLAAADGGLQPNRLYAAYAERLGADARSRRTVQKYLGELVRADLVDEEGASQSRRYHATVQLGSPGANRRDA